MTKTAEMGTSSTQIPPSSTENTAQLDPNEGVSSQTGYFDPDNTQFEAKLTPSREDAVG